VFGGTPRHLLGRVGAATSLLLSGLAVLGPVTAGALAQLVGPTSGWWCLAALTGVLTLAGWAPLRRTAVLDAPPDTHSDTHSDTQSDAQSDPRLDVLAHQAPADPKEPRHDG